MNERRRCNATNRRGERCRLAPLRGTTVCRMHGGKARQVQRKAQERLALAEALERGDRRSPEIVLMDTLHAADILFRDVRVKLGENEAITPADLDAFVQAFERANRIAKIVMDAKVMDRISRQAQVEGEYIAGVLNRAMSLAELDEEAQSRLRPALRQALLENDDQHSAGPKAIESGNGRSPRDAARVPKT